MIIGATIAGSVVKPAVASPQVFFVAHGDSISAGAGLGFSELPYEDLVGQSIAANQSKVVRVIRKGIPGQGFSYVWPSSGDPNNLTVGGPINVDPFLNVAGITTYLVVFAGTNDQWPSLGNLTAAQTLAQFDVYMPARLATGIPAANICVCTMLPRQGGFPGTTRADFNSGLVSRVTTYGYKIARLDLDPNIGPDGSETNTKYFQDQIHPTQNGHNIINTIVYAALFP